MSAIYQLLLMSTTKLNIVIEKATCHRMLWVCVPLIISFNTFLLFGGSAADSRVLASALSRSDPSVVPPGMCNQLVNVQFL
jgi:hypothetical protein